MKIGIEATCLFNKRGYGRYARALIGSTLQIDKENEYICFVDSLEKLDDISDRVEIRYVAASTPAALAASSTSRRSLGDMWKMSRAMSDSKLDILLFPTVYTYVPVLSPAKKVVFIYDAIPEIYPELTLPHKRARLFWQIKSSMARRQADAIVTISEYSKKILARKFNISDRRLQVVDGASDPIFRVLNGTISGEQLKPYGIPTGGRLVVYLGGFGPHKNVMGLVRSFSLLANTPEYQDIYLVLVGEYRNEIFHSQITEIQQEIHRAGVTERTVFTGYMPDDQVVVLMNAATVLVLPSLMEGIGLPALEAAACGCPVIATRESPLPEMLGEGAIYINPQDPDDLTSALRRVLDSSEIRATLRTKGLEATSNLSWERSARNLITIISGLESL
jgi:glycosyltransferase involved in cell wall biosynthesis